MSDFMKQSRESTRDLLLDIKLNNLSTKAVPKRAPSPKTPVFKRHSNKPITTSSNYTGDLAIKDMVLDAAINKISNIASGATQPSIPKIVSPVTQQMIEEAQAEAKAPVTINGQNFRYRPTSLPIPNLVTAGNISTTLTDAEISDIETAKQNAVDQINLDNAAIEQIDQNLKDIQNKYDIEKPQFDEYYAMITSQSLNKLKIDYPEVKKLNKAKSVEFLLNKQFGTPDMRKSFNDIVNQLTADRERIANNIMNEEAIIEGLNRQLEQNNEDIKQNEAENYAVRKQNAEALNAYAADLNVLNKGMFNIERLNNETDDEYRNRLIQTGQETISDEEIRLSAGLSNSIKAKQNLEQLLNDKSKIETIVKMLTDDEKFLLNKQFPRVKKSFVDVYGINNKQVTEQDAIDLIKDVLVSPVVPQALVAQAVGGTSVSASPVTTTGPAKQKLIQFIGILQGTGVPIRSPPSNANISFLIKMIDDQKIEIPDEILDDVSKATIDQLHKEGNIPYYTLGIPSKVPVTTSAAAVPEATLTGIGIPHYPKLTRFGKVMISPDKLYFKNLLIIRSHNGKPLTGLTNTHVSDVMVSILMKALEGHKISKSELNLLSQREKHMYDNLMYMSGGHKVHEHSMDKSSQEMKNRLELIEGELEAGNNSELLKKELHGLLHKMAHSGLITLSAAAKHYKSMKEFYF